MTPRRRRGAKPDRMLRDYGRWALTVFRNGLGDIDGGSLQEKAVEIGLLVPKTMTKPCGEHCACFENGDGPFECYFLAKGVRLVRKAK